MEVDGHETINPKTKRGLELGKVGDNTTENDTGKPGISDEAAAMVTDENTPGEKGDLGNVKDRKKRSKKDGTDSTSLESAGSLEDPDRSQ
jgi:hypothetical protein